MGSPEFGLQSLITLYSNPALDLIAVFSRADAPKGRNQLMSETPIKAWASQHHISTYTPMSKEEVAAKINELKPDLLIVIAYGMILPKSITDHYLCINVHASILPKYRGASPIHAALLNNDKKTGITLIKMNEYMDRGDILATYTLDIEETDNLQTLHDKLATLSSNACTNIIQNIHALTFTPQDNEHASYCQKLHTSDFELKPTDSIEQKLGKIKAFSPRPGAFIIRNGKQIKILEALRQEDQLIPITIKPEGKRMMSYKDYCLAQPPFTL